MVTDDTSPKAFSYIRFSTPEQLKGDSLRRQLQSSREYAESRGLILDETLSMRDLGLSAYHGEHRTKGALGKFLELVDTGEIPKGSTLIVESLDRLSREQVFDAFTRFSEIINRGIKIVTLIDRMEYGKESLHKNWTPLVISLTIMARAHEESATKSKRGQEAWIAKRENTHKRKLTGRCPAWLQLSKDEKKFDPISDRVKLIQRIFKLCLDGYGADKIVRMFNAEKIPAWVAKSGWHKSYIQKILHNQAVIGEFQPHKLDKSNGQRKRIQIGNPIQDYFPSVIDKDIFYRVQEMMSANRGKGGRNGTVTNLFGHVAKCGLCGSSMQFLNKGKGDIYLICDSARRGLGCQKESFRYNEFEENFLNLCGQLNVATLMPGDDKMAHEIAELRDMIHSIDGQLTAVRKKKLNVDEAIAQADGKGALKHLTNTLEEAIVEENRLETQRTKVTAAMKKTEVLAQQTAQQIESVKQLINYMAGAEGSERVTIRTKLKSEIRRVVKRIDVFPNGPQNRVLSWIPVMKYVAADVNEFLTMAGEIGFEPEIFKSIAGYEALLAKNDATISAFNKFVGERTGKDHRGFGIYFFAGGFREVFMKDGNYKIGTSYLDAAGQEKSFYEMLGKSE